MERNAEQLARSIVERLQKAGHTAYYAGGCVRDRLMNRTPKDFDVATSALPAQVLQLFPRAQEVGAAFGVVLIVEGRGENRAQVEVATFRAEGSYSDGRHPDAVRFTNAQEDARRRDFTCNGLFFDPLAHGSSGELHDFVGGRADIDAKILRAIGDPAARFAEDHLRMMRAIRFAAKLNFTIEPATFTAIQASASQIRIISRERTREELAMMLGFPNIPARVTAVNLLQESGLLAQLWPADLLQQPESKRKWQALSRLPASADWITALAAVQLDMSNGELRGIERAAALLRDSFLLSNVDTSDLAWLLQHQIDLQQWESLTKARFKRLIADPRWERLASMYAISAPTPERQAAFGARIAALRAEGVAPVPFITGETLIALGAVPGRAFKQWLEVLYDRQLEGELLDEAAAKAAARELMRSS